MSSSPVLEIIAAFRGCGDLTELVLQALPIHGKNEKQCSADSCHTHPYETFQAKPPTVNSTVDNQDFFTFLGPMLALDTGFVSAKSVKQKKMEMGRTIFV
jgi:hypothetical protein